MLVIVSYLALITILLVILTSVKQRWFLKSLSVFIVAFYCLFLNNAISGYAGWPTDEQLPEEAEFHWAVVFHPTSKDNGVIYVWASPAGTKVPRSYKLPYTNKMHEKTSAAMGAKAKGKRMKIGKMTNHGSGNEEQDGPDGATGKGSSSPERQEYEFYDFPIAPLPLK